MAESNSPKFAKEVFDVDVNNHELLKMAYESYLAEGRQVGAKTLRRGEVRGGGKKPWRQKGTGRARAGTIRSNIWRGGAVVFGPTPRDYSFKVNKKVRALALRMALSSRLAEENLLVVNAFELPEVKTKHFVKIADALGLKKALLVLPENNEKVELSARNIPGITIMTPAQLSVYEILRHPQLILLEGAVAPVEARLK